MIYRDLKKVLDKFNLSSLHDYNDKGDHVEWLGIYEDDMIFLRTLISQDWAIVERRRNPENNFLRVDIVPRLIK